MFVDRTKLEKQRVLRSGQISYLTTELISEDFVVSHLKIFNIKQAKFYIKMERDHPSFSKKNTQPQKKAQQLKNKFLRLS